MDKPDTTIAVGDRVRSDDFPWDRGDRPPCYAEGVVEEITPPIEGCPRYKIRVEARVFNGETREFVPGEYVYPPVNGTPQTMGGPTSGVKKIRGSP